MSIDKRPSGSRALLASMHAPGELLTSRVTRGAGVWLTLEDGRVVLDAGSMSSNILGHCHPEIVAAIREAASVIYCGDGAGYAPRDQAAADLLRVAFADEDWADAVVLTVSSSEAADIGLLLAQILTDRETLVSRELAYHGGVGLGREISTHPLWGAHLAGRNGGITPRPFPTADTNRLMVPECGIGRAPDGHDCSERCLRGAPEAIAHAAAVMMDYSQGAVFPSAQYQDALAELTRSAGALWIADETVTAFGRLGHAFAFGRGESRPDIVTLGKGITGGAVPGGALVLSREIVERIGDRRWMTSSTYRGNPITVAAMSAVQRVIARDGIVDHAAKLGAGIAGDLQTVAQQHPSVEAIYGEGLMWIIRLAGDPEHDEATWRGDGTSVPIAEVVHATALDSGVFIGVLGGTSLWIIPPLIISASQLADAIEALDTALSVADEALNARNIPA